MESNSSIMQHKEIIITLIRDHITNTRLVSGLNALGWHSLDYHLNLSGAISSLLALLMKKKSYLKFI
jgi:hypothetical protein